MAQDINKRHWVCESTKLLATNGGQHIYNVKMPEDCDNGTLLQLGNYVEDEYYEGQAVDSQSAVLVLNPPLPENTALKDYASEDRYYNAKYSIVRCYSLAPRDRYTISEEAFSEAPEIGKYVAWDASAKEYTLNDTPAGSGFVGQIVKKVNYTYSTSWTIEVVSNPIA